jgi:DEAD/DEAH box helicase domain-containing protein
VLDPDNPHVLGPHLAAAAAELPLTEGDLAMFGPDARRLVEALVARGILRRRPTGWFWAREDRPADHISLRGVTDVVAIVEARTPAGSSAPSTRRRPTGRCTRGPCTCTRARRGW